MSLATLLSQTVTIVRSSQAAASVDAEGNSSVTPASIQYAGLIQQQNTTEIRVGPDTFISNHRLFLAPDALVDQRDQVSEGGRTFEVIGMPDIVRTPRGAHHLEVNLREVIT
jgi:hypothetical protein